MKCELWPPNQMLLYDINFHSCANVNSKVSSQTEREDQNVAKGNKRKKGKKKINEVKKVKGQFNENKLFKSFHPFFFPTRGTKLSFDRFYHYTAPVPMFIYTLLSLVLICRRHTCDNEACELPEILFRHMRISTADLRRHPRSLSPTYPLSLSQTLFWLVTQSFLPNVGRKDCVTRLTCLRSLFNLIFAGTLVIFPT